VEGGVDHADEGHGGEAVAGAAEAGEGEVGLVLAGLARDAQWLAGGFDLVEEGGDGGEVAGDVDGEDARGALAGQDEEPLEVERHRGDGERAEGLDEERDAVFVDVADELERDVKRVWGDEGGGVFQTRVGAEGFDYAGEVGLRFGRELDGGEEAHGGK
jgi:hypothetical protein